MAKTPTLFTHFPDFFTSKDIGSFSPKQLREASDIQIARCTAEIFWLKIYEIAQHKHVDHMTVSLNLGGNPYHEKTINFYDTEPSGKHAILSLMSNHTVICRHPEFFHLESHLWESALKVKVYMTSAFNALDLSAKEEVARKICKKCSIKGMSHKNKYLKESSSEFDTQLRGMSWPQRIDKNTNVDEFLSMALPYDFGKKRQCLIEKKTLEQTIQTSSVKKASLHKI